jgi:Transglycosylase-like domain
VSDLKAQAVALSEQLVQQQLQVDAYQQQYSVLSTRLEADDQAIAATGQQIAEDQQQIAAKSDAVRRQAVRSYIDYGSGGAPDNGLFTSGQETAQAASEYSSIAVGNITASLDQLHTAEAALQVQQVVLRERQTQDASDQSRQGAALGQADGTAAHLASLRAEVTGQLATAVAGAQAKLASGAARAVTTADRVAAGEVGAAPSPAPAPNGAGIDPALPPFLQCVIQAESGGDYGAVSPNGLYMGAFQFSQPTWNGAAAAAGRPDLIGVPPNLASKPDQDTLAVVLFSLDGGQPWLGDRCTA